MPQFTQQLDAIDRFIPKTKKASNGCVEWTGRLDRGGYGRFWNDGEMARAHREAWKLFVSSIPNGLHVLHRCDNRRCVNPTHLFLGTHRDNMDDMLAKGRANKRGYCKLTITQVRWIRKRYAKGGITQTQLAESFGVKQGTISSLLTRKNWNRI